MKIGIPTELKNHEYRVAVTPAGVHELVKHGQRSWCSAARAAARTSPTRSTSTPGAKLVDDADAVWGDAEMIIKVKEPIPEEYHRLREGQVLFTYLHLAASRSCTDALLNAETTAIAYETVQVGGALPLLAPMSEIAGRLAPQVGAYHLMRFNGGRGVLPGGVPGVAPAKVVVIGGGVAGCNAAQIAVGMGAEVTVLDVNLERLRQIDALYRGRVRTLYSTAYAIEQAVLEADLVIGAVLIPGAKAPKLVSEDLVRRMKPGSVLVDIAIDQGGCFEDLPPHDPRRADVPRCTARSSTAWRTCRGRAEHLDLRADQRHAALRARARRQGLEGRAPRRSGAPARPQRARRPARPTSPSPPRTACRTPRSTRCSPLAAGGR